VLKTLERMCDRYIRDVILRLKPLHKNQHAYQAGKSVDSALHQVVYNVEKSMELDKKTLATFLDLEGAFNKVTYGAINAALRRFDLDRTLIRWIMAMLSNRILSIDLFGAHTTGLADRGCPQGGVLPPILWNMTVDNLLEKLNESGYLAIGYADDIAILISGAFEEVLSSLMSSAFRIVEEWCSESGLSVNPEKTGFILFTKKRNLLALQMPKLFGIHLKLTDKVKYLGVILDSRLEWREHIEERTKKALRIFWQCRSTFGKKWGLKPAVLYWMYRAIVRPILIYGCMVWAPRSELRVVQKKINQIQRLACLSITGVMTSTPTAALEILLSLPPLDLFLKQEAELTVYRLYKGGNWIAQERDFGHARILAELKSKFREVEMPDDQISATFCFERNFETRQPTRSDWESRTPPIEADVTVYTDGSKTDEGTGAGIHSEELDCNISMPLGVYTTVFQSEIIAISESSQEMLRVGVKNKKILICSDSESSIESLSSFKISSGVVLQCYRALETLSRNNNVTLTWVPGHSGILGNEKADKLARKGSSSKFVGPEPAVGKYAGLVKYLVKSEAEKAHQRRWETITTCRQSKEFLVGCNTKNTKFLLSLSRVKLRGLVGVLTGHTNLNYHLHKIGILSDATCRGCSLEPETARHFVCTCPALKNLRTRHLGDFYFTPEEQLELDLPNILSFIIGSKWLIGPERDI
jgi:ribonuclease HI